MKIEEPVKADGRGKLKRFESDFGGRDEGAVRSEQREGCRPLLLQRLLVDRVPSNVGEEDKESPKEESAEEVKQNLDRNCAVTR